MTFLQKLYTAISTLQGAPLLAKYIHTYLDMIARYCKIYVHNIDSEFQLRPDTIYTRPTIILKKYPRQGDKTCINWTL